MSTTQDTSYDGEHITHTLRSGETVDLYWSETLGVYVTVPNDEDDE